MIKTISMRRTAGSGGKGAWVRNNHTKDFVPFTRISHVANSGNQTLEWDLPTGTYTCQETWYGKVRRWTEIVEAEKESQARVAVDGDL